MFFLESHAEPCPKSRLVFTKKTNPSDKKFDVFYIKTGRLTVNFSLDFIVRAKIFNLAITVQLFVFMSCYWLTNYLPGLACSR